MVEVVAVVVDARSRRRRRNRRLDLAAPGATVAASSNSTGSGYSKGRAARGTTAAIFKACFQKPPNQNKYARAQNNPKSETLNENQTSLRL